MCVHLFGFVLELAKVLKHLDRLARIDRVELLQPLLALNDLLQLILLLQVQTQLVVQQVLLFFGQRDFCLLLRLLTCRSGRRLLWRLSRFFLLRRRNDLVGDRIGNGSVANGAESMLNLVVLLSNAVDTCCRRLELLLLLLDSQELLLELVKLVMVALGGHRRDLVLLVISPVVVDRAWDNFNFCRVSLSLAVAVGARERVLPLVASSRNLRL